MAGAAAAGRAPGHSCYSTTSKHQYVAHACCDCCCELGLHSAAGHGLQAHSAGQLHCLRSNCSRFWQCCRPAAAAVLLHYYVAAAGTAAGGPTAGIDSLTATWSCLGLAVLCFSTKPPASRHENNRLRMYAGYTYSHCRGAAAARGQGNCSKSSNTAAAQAAAGHT
jgi:hypothetical protein